MNTKGDEEIMVTIRVVNSRDNRVILSGRSYTFSQKRNTLIKDMFEVFVKNFPEDVQHEIRRYRIWTANDVQLQDDNKIEDAFSDKDDSYLDVDDKFENIFNAILFNIV
mgnify:FL=1